MRTVVRLRIGNNRIFMGKGVKELLDAIDEVKSIKKATQITGISYPKAIRMIKTFEEEMGFPAVVSEKGGTNFGGTKLTPKGREALECYREIEKQVEKYANQLVEEKFRF